MSQKKSRPLLVPRPFGRVPPPPCSKCLASRSTPWRPARSPSCAPSWWLARSHSLHRMPQSSWPSSSPFALLPPPRFEGQEECVGCRPVPLDRPARRARAQPHDILRPSLPPTVRCVATLPLLLVPGNCGVRRGWRWRARPALRARRGADRAPADGRVHHAAGGRHSSPPKSPGAFRARSPHPHRRVGQDTSGEVEVESVVDCHRAQARMVAPMVAPAPARAAEEADALPSNTIKLSPYHPNPTPGP